MQETIGKYRIETRIGRGGMGMVFKAHDPILDRPVALKVISSDVEVTDELRARFFREAQACARLSHPNIVTIYDMGEHEGRLYIVMELLDGEELRKIIAQRPSLPLEDKLSVMAQICDGLHYAHQKGIVHRDVKPGNIFLLKSGQVKILDFGIAQMATTEGALTRTGLIMGTLKYISPEQVRGRADPRSDMYSVGVVCYELLGQRLPFIAEDPIHLLEKLRTEEPTPLLELDPSLPSDVAVVVERALRKNPDERYPDLGTMRASLDRVQRSLAEEADRARGRLLAIVQQIDALHAGLAERLGHVAAPADVPSIPDRARLHALQALELDLAARMEALRRQVAHADALAPAVRRATAHIDAGDFALAIVDLEAVIGEIPEHVRASGLLVRARTEAEAHQRRERVADLLDDARAMLDDENYARGLELLDEAAQVASEAEALRQIDALRQTAQAGLAAHEAAQRAREHADRLLAEVSQAQRAARRWESRHAPTLWNEAERNLMDGRAALGRGVYPEAGQAFERALDGYRRFEDAARAAEGEEREAAERALREARERRRQAQESPAGQLAAELLDAAGARLAEGEAALTDERHDRAAALFAEAVALYRRAEEEGRRRQRELVARLLSDARAAVERGDFGRALAVLEEGAGVSSDSQATQEIEAVRQSAAAGLAAQEAAERARDHAVRVLAQLDEAKDLARQRPVRHAPALWNEAEAKLAEGQAALDRAAYEDAGLAFEHALSGYRRFEASARAAEAAERQAAERALADAGQHERQAQDAGAPQYAPELWTAATAKLAEAEAAQREQRHDRANALLGEAGALYRRALGAAREARQREQQHAEDERNEAVRAQQEASAIGAERLASASWQEAASKRRDAEAELVQEHFAAAGERFAAARDLYRQAERQASDVRRRERENADGARRALEELRRAALAAEAPTHAGPAWKEAEATAAAGEASFRQEAYAAASQAFDHAAMLYRSAATIAEESTQALVDADKRRDAAQMARRTAAETRAAKYASESWQAAEELLARGQAALGRQAHRDAQNLFVEARRLYAKATRAAGQAANAEARRVDSLLLDARHALDAGDPEACLRRVSALFLLRPGHEEAEELRKEAERKIARPRAATQAGDATMPITPPAESTVPAAGTGGEVAQPPRSPASDTGTIETVRATTATFAPTKDASRPLELSRTPVPAPPESGVAPMEPAAAPAELAATSSQPVAASSQPIAASAEPVATSSQPIAASRKPVAVSPEAVVAAEPVRTSVERTGSAAVAAAPPAESVRPSPRADDTERRSVLDDDDTITIVAQPRGMAPHAERAPAPVKTGAARRPAGLRWLAVGGIGAVAAALLIYVLGPGGKDTPKETPGSAGPSSPLAKSPTTPGQGPGPGSSAPAPSTPSKQTSELPVTKPVPPPREPEPAPAPAPRPNDPSAAVPPISTPSTPPVPPVPAGTPSRPSDPTPAPAPSPATLRGTSQAPPKTPGGLGSGATPTLPPAVRRPDPAAGKEDVSPAPKTPQLALTRDLSEATQAQRASADARQEATQAQAPRLAAAAFGAARDKHAEGDALLSQSNPSAAKQRFVEGQQLYRQATQQAVAALGREKNDAEQARGPMEAARVSAEQTSAERYAAQPFTAGRSKEREGQGAFNRAEYGPAAKLFRDAQKNYDEARKDADKAIRLVAIKTDADQARRAMAARRDDAVKAEAPRLAKVPFDAAQAKQTEAETLADRESYAEATAVYRDAAERYRAAASRAGVAREQRTQADSARDRMVAERQRARDSAPDFAAAQAEERLAVGLYERLEYMGAAEKFRSAETLYARTATPEVTVPPPTKAPDLPQPSPPAPAPKSRPARPLPPSF